MILKLKNQSGWAYFEGEHIEISGFSWGNRKLLSEGTIYILNPKVDNRTEEVETNPGYWMNLILVIQNGVTKSIILTDESGYILNNEGKTIDKIS